MCGDCRYFRQSPIALNGTGNLTAEVIAFLECDKACKDLRNEETFTPCVEFDPEPALPFERLVAIGLAKPKGRPKGALNKVKTGSGAPPPTRPTRHSYDPRKQK